MIRAPEVEPVARNALVVLGRRRARGDGVVRDDLLEWDTGNLRRTRKVRLGSGILIAFVEARDRFRRRQIDRIVGAERQSQNFAPRGFRGIAFLPSGGVAPPRAA